jgi:membrane protein DedA with SNARE-associated domain
LDDTNHGLTVIPSLRRIAHSFLDGRFMEALLEHFITQSVAYSLFAVMLVAFLESLALVGLILPGTVMMAGLGALIGGGQVGFYHAWAAGIVGCLLGDWISFWLGGRFKGPLHRWSFMKKNKALLDKTEHALHQHSMFTILVGRFVGPTRPLVPMVAGMLDLPVSKFIVPNIIGCVFWPPVYFLPGILAGAAIDIPADMQSSSFKWLLLLVALALWLAGWLCWRWWRSGKASADRLTPYLPRARLHWLAPSMAVLAVASFVAIQMHPMMPIYRSILWKVLTGHH